MARRKRGLKKYGTGIERDDLSTDEWLQHAQEEAMDLCVYLERVRWQLKHSKVVAVVEWKPPRKKMAMVRSE
jgi:hypothetical protein